MKVLMFCPQFAPLVGGAERQAEKLGKQLIAKGVDVAVWTPLVDQTSSASELLDGLPVRRFHLSDLSKQYPGLHGIGLINAPWIALQIMYKLWRHVGAADVVHCHIGSLQTVAVACVARLRGVPVICKAAMADDRSDLGEAAKAGVIGRVVAWLGRYVFTRWVATTLAVRDALLRAGVSGDTIVVIPNGVDAVTTGWHLKERPVRNFLYLGRLSTNSDRDITGLLLAFDALADAVPDVELAVVGGGNLLNDIRDAAKACRHASRISVPGFGDSREWMNWADCFVLPSRREGLSNALLEAMAAGLPCIANDIPPNREVLMGGAVGVLVPVSDVTALCTAMSSMVKSEYHAGLMAVAGYTHVTENYSLVSVAGMYMRLYQKLVSGSECETSV